MSEKEKKGSGGATEASAIVLVDQTSATRVKPYKPTEIQDSDVHHKRTRAPVVPSVAEELKNLAEDTTRNENVGSTELKDNERAMSSEHKHKASKKSSKRRDSSPDIRNAPQGVDPLKDNTASKTLQQPSPTQPIPPQIQEEKSEASLLQSTKQAADKNAEEDSITEEIAELQTIENTKKHSEWSDDEEAGGLPRSESRGSRVSRAVRQLFCCGVRCEAASEDNISTRSGFNHGI